MARMLATARLLRSSMPIPQIRLCLLLTRELCHLDPLTVVREAVAGGVDAIQLREKEMTTAQRFQWGEALKELCMQLRVPLIINDDAEVAAALHADGLHIGQDDLPVADARRLLQPGQWLGLSTHSLEQLDDAADMAVDYAGFGPVFPTPTKGYENGLGPESLLGAVIHSRVPLLAIGGITPSNAALIPERAGLAVSSAVCAADSPREVAAALRARGPIDLPSY